MALRWRIAGVAGGLLLAATAQGVDTFKLCSQNTLHLGYSSSNQTKINSLQAEFATCDVTLLQETMRRALDPPPTSVTPAVLPNGALRAVRPANVTIPPPPPPPIVPPTVYTWNIPFSDIIGKTSYKESYATIVLSKFPIFSDPTSGQVIFFPSATVAANFSRPPGAILIQTGSTADKWTWLVNYHAIFGKSQRDREDEIKKMNDVATELANMTIGTTGLKSTRIIIVGDWNLDATNAAYNNLKTGTYLFQVQPNVDTSLTTTGTPSEPYDHFAWSNSVTVTNPAVITPGNMVTWRNTVSDHMGISCTVDY